MAHAKNRHEHANELVGKIVSDRYEVQELIAVGAMGYVYRAEHTLMKKQVALKVMRPELLGDEQFVERFQREAQAAARIDHPNVCAATDFGHLDDDTFFLVMEFLDGPTLLDELRDHGRMEPKRAVSITLQMADALGRAHETGVIHRDLKPSNVGLLERDGGPDFVKIMDFGFARLQFDSMRLTRTGITMGTPSYMSPELALAEEADERSDLYTVGILLFEMLTGQKPFSHQSKAVLLNMHVQEPAPSVHEVAPEAHIPSDLADITARLLEKSPDDRFQSASELEDALRSADLTPHSTPEPQASPPPSPINSAPPLPTGPPPAKSPRIPPLIDRAKALARQGIKRFRELPPHTRYGIAAFGLTMLALPPLLLAIGLLFMGDEVEEPSDEMVFAADTVEQPSLSDKRRMFVEEHGLDDLLVGKDEGQRIAALEAVAAKHQEHAHFHYVLGAARREAGRHDAALKSFQSALELDPAYEEEESLPEYLVERYASKSPPPNAEGLVRLMLNSEKAAPATREALFEVAINGRWADRKNARDILRETKQLDALDQWQRVAIDLRLTGKSCERIKRLVNELEKLGDPGALQALRKTSRRPASGCGFFKRNDCYECMRADLDRAIRKLEAVEKKPPPQPAEAEGPAVEQ